MAQDAFDSFFNILNSYTTTWTTATSSTVPFYSQKTTAVPYTGSYLPALMYVTDLEIDLEKVSYEELAWQGCKINQETLTKHNRARFILSELETEYKSQVSTINSLQKQLADLDEKLQRKDEAKQEKEITVDETIQLQEHIKRAKARDKEMQDDLLLVKKSKSKAKSLFKKLSSLCHPDKTGGDEVLTELFIAGKLAVDLNDEDVLKDLISKAMSYKSGNTKRNLLDKFKLKKKRAKDQLYAAQQQRQSFQKSFLNSVLVEANKGKDALNKMFVSTLINTEDDLRLKIKMRLHVLNFSSSITTSTFLNTQSSKNKS